MFVCLSFVCVPSVCACVLVWRLRAMHAPFAFSLLTTATPLSYPILSEAIPLENLHICLFSICCTPKIHLFCSLPISSQALLFSPSVLCMSNVPSKGSMWEATESIPEMYVC